MPGIPIIMLNEIKDCIEQGIKEVKLICEVVEKSDYPEDKLTVIKVKDPTGIIEVKLFGEENERKLITNEIREGDKLLVIGRIVEVGTEVYISPKGIRKIDNDWYEYYLARYNRYKKRRVKKM